MFFFKRADDLKNVIIDSVCTTMKDLIKIEEALFLFKNFLIDVKRNKKMSYCIGNGGSAGIASHFCNDLIKTLKIPANTLTDPNILTCLANDFGYENCYSEALKVNMNEKDLLIAISSSGNSLNIINAVKTAKEKKAIVITLSGFDSNNHLRSMGNLNFWLNITEYGLIEMGHFFILHTLIDMFNNIIHPNLNIKFLEKCMKK